MNLTGQKRKGGIMDLRDGVGEEAETGVPEHPISIQMSKSAVCLRGVSTLTCSQCLSPYPSTGPLAGFILALCLPCISPPNLQ